MGSMYMWQPAHAGTASCWAKRWRAVVLGVITGGVMFTLLAGGGTLPHSGASKMNLPRCTGSVESAVAKVALSDGWVSRPARWLGPSISWRSASGLVAPVADPASGVRAN